MGCLRLKLKNANDFRSGISGVAIGKDGSRWQALERFPHSLKFGLIEALWINKI